ncbi:MAG: patatin-like phospholipase family protein [Flavobacteriales bacterium]|nr:patatin-like phospholipase family protein [Flavobacteriales bacterium]MCW8913222.1 patatin-like phospholipase family protein [Flavobacteriales bacterium]MCW8936806.1 patatin-like phospholipase family protein [Flavobacteriales bacterium]MCW8941239.1 patatin-like phospholipase family protein [Flavobacteriales bacterium]MCW8968646.1 patatin-like phospholipase family protein [Flavobacteriales bacterium]
MIRKIVFFFPVQLFLVNLKRNHLLLLFWIILFSIINESFANKYGIPYLFLAPEYLNTISFWSYMIMGFSIGGFVMTYNITGYIINSGRFQFIASLRRPFLVYCINNSLIPLAFILYYIYKVIFYHLENESSSVIDISIYVLGIIIGYTLNVVVSLTYFLSTNKNIFKLLGITPDEESGKPINTLFLRDESLYNFLRKREKWHVESYLNTPFRSKPAKDISHYDTEMLRSITKHNHLNASFFEILIFISYIVLGLFHENAFFIIPASASVILFFTMILIILSALHTWLKGWTTFAFLLLLFVINMLSQSQIFSYDNMAYGLNYNTEKADYSIKELNKLRLNEENIENDKNNSIDILNAWKKNTNEKKPKLIFLNTSGGGSRAMMWTYFTLHHLDSIFNNQFFNKIHLISGSSGGMIGAAYYRELYLREQHDKTKFKNSYEHVENMGRDLLNPIAFSIATNDFFIRMKTYNDGKYTYLKDRGYAFERQLLINTNNVLDKRMRDYVAPEKVAEIPMMIFSPTITNDGRRLLIASQPISYLSYNLPKNNTLNNPIVENVEFTKLFKQQDAMNLKFTSAIRMSATFPYIMPSVTLPTNPQIEVMDAGVRDNYGAITTFKYMHTFKEWINENTSGVIIIQIRDKEKNKKVTDSPLRSIAETFSTPIGSFYSNLFIVQDYNLDDMVQYLGNDIEQQVHIIDFELENEESRVSLSWHLTPREKSAILKAMNSKNNQQSLARLKGLLEN